MSAKTLDEAVAAALEVLREYRDSLPRVPARSVYCGNLPCHSPHGVYRCGEPTTVWNREAWEIEYRARDLEDAHARRAERAA